MKHIVLFDIDGVLIHPLGYRQAFLDSLAYFAERMGLSKQQLPGEDQMKVMESLGITSEWDMLVITIASWLEEMFTIQNPGGFFESFNAVWTWAGKQNWQPVEVDFKAVYRKAADEYLKPAPFHALAALAAACGASPAQALDWAGQQCLPVVFEVSNRLQSAWMGGDKVCVPTSFRLDIFEDSISGLQAGGAAVNLLRSLGYQIHFQQWGVLSNPYSAQALLSANENLVANVNDGVQKMLAEMDYLR